jgi:hypothetical protein
MFGIVNGVVLILSFLFVPESRYNRPTDAFEEAVHVHHEGHTDQVLIAATKHGIALDFIRFQNRTFHNDLKSFHGQADWKAFIACLVQMFQCFFFPNVF